MSCHRSSLILFVVVVVVTVYSVNSILLRLLTVQSQKVIKGKKRSLNVTLKTFFLNVTFSG